MKKIIATAALVLATLTPAAMAAQKIAVVDVQAVVMQHPERDAVAQTLEKEFGERNAEIAKLQKQLKALIEDGKKNAPTMNDQQRRDHQRKGEDLQAELQRKGKALQEDINRRSQQEQQKILQDVKTAIEAVAKADGYDLILDARSALYASDPVNISAKVVESINKGN